MDDALNPDRTATWGGSNLGMVHEDWRARGGYSFGVKHSHLDGMDGSKSECNNMYDTTLAYEALNNPFPVPVSIGIPLKDLISEDVLLFPGPGSYTLKPTVNAICAGGYMQRHGSKGPIAIPRIRPGEAELVKISIARAKELCTKPEKKHKPRRRRRKIETIPEDFTIQVKLKNKK